MRESLVERGLLEIYRFLPPPLLERFDPEQITDIDEFLGFLAKARVVQEIEEHFLARAFSAVFSEG